MQSFIEMNRQFSVIVIDSDPQIRRALRYGLARSSFKVILCQTAEEGLDQVAVSMPDAIFLDTESVEGVELCKQIREWSKVPIIVISAKASEEDKINALELGADDFVAKPFGMGELVARLKAVLRRTTSQEQEAAIFSCPGLTIDYSKRSVVANGKYVHLTPKEYDLLRYLSKNVNRILTHRQLLLAVWGDGFDDDHHTLRVHIANLRNKIELQPEHPALIHTEVRIGYRFRPSMKKTMEDGSI